MYIYILIIVVVIIIIISIVIVINNPNNNHDDHHHGSLQNVSSTTKEQLNDAERRLRCQCGPSCNVEVVCTQIALLEMLHQLAGFRSSPGKIDTRNSTKLDMWLWQICAISLPNLSLRVFWQRLCFQHATMNCSGSYESVSTSMAETQSYKYMNI